MGEHAPVPVNALRLACRCGATGLAASGRPIVGVVCGCADCRAAEAVFVDMGAPPTSAGAEGTAAILFRNDRVSVLRGGEHLRQFRLTDSSPTRRIVAACCTSPMFLDFEKGFWLSLYRDRADPPETVTPLRSSNARFVFRLMAAWAGAGFRLPARDPALVGLPELVGQEARG